MAEEERLRQEMEEHLRVLASSSPAAILTLDDEGRAHAANESACELLGFPPRLNLKGIPIRPYLPVLADALNVAPAPLSHRDAGRQRSLPGFS